jgi:hypothetical protein
MTVGEVEQRMSHREVYSWLAFDRLRPLPDEAADLHNAMLCSIAANMLRGDGPPISIDEFRLYRPANRAAPVVRVDGLSEAERMAAGLRKG